MFLVQVSQLDSNYLSEVQIVNNFLELDLPLTFPGQLQLHNSLVSSLVFTFEKKMSWN